MSELRHLRLVNAVGAALRTATFEERPHLVVPVVALIGDEVVWAANSQTPEFVPAAEIERSFPEWCGRPVVGDHPKVNGQFVSANPPEIAERFSFGRIVNPRFENGRLMWDVWLDREKAERVGAEAVDVIRRAEAGEPIEVSVGTHVEVEAIGGKAPNGKEFFGIWRNLGSDHCAMLPAGARGACSNEMGCGAPRLARHLITAEGLTLADEPAPETPVTAHPTTVRDKPPPPTPPPNRVTRGTSVAETEIKETPMTEAKKRSLRERLRGLFAGGDALELVRFRGAESEEVSDGDLRGMLDRALFAEEPAYIGIDAVFGAEGLVVYAVAPEQQVALYRRGFALADGAVTLAAEKEQVEPTTTYQPVKAAAAAGDEVKPAAAPPCGCQKPTGAERATEEKDMKKEERIAALIANPRSPFAEGHRPLLAAASDEQLADFEKAAAEPPKVEEPPKKEEEQQAGTVAIPVEELTALRAMAAEGIARKAARKNELLSTIKAAKQVAYTEPELAAMEVEQLEKVALLVAASKPKTFAGRVASPVDDDRRVPPPPSMESVVRAARGLEQKAS